MLTAKRFLIILLFAAAVTTAASDTADQNDYTTSFKCNGKPDQVQSILQEAPKVPQDTNQPIVNDIPTYVDAKNDVSPTNADKNMVRQRDLGNPIALMSVPVTSINEPELVGADKSVPRPALYPTEDEEAVQPIKTSVEAASKDEQKPENIPESIDTDKLGPEPTPCPTNEEGKVQNTPSIVDAVATKEESIPRTSISNVDKMDDTVPAPTPYLSEDKDHMSTGSKITTPSIVPSKNILSENNVELSPEPCPESNAEEGNILNDNGEAKVYSSSAGGGIEVSSAISKSGAASDGVGANLLGSI